MRFSADAWPGLADGTITRTFRTWSRPQVKVGGRYRVGRMLLEVDAVRQVPVARLTRADAKAAGEKNVAALLARLRATEPTVWRIDLHYVGPDDRIALRASDDLTDAQLRDLQVRLDRLDAHAPRAWTRVTLDLIAERPAVVSTELAAHLNMEREPFKINVRKLKNLGLTESLEIGYRISPRGARFMEFDAQAPSSSHASATPSTSTR